MAAKMYGEQDVNQALLRDRRVAIIGFGSQAHAHAQNLKDSGFDVIVGLRDASPSRAKAEQAGLQVTDIAQAARDASVIVMLIPDEEQPRVYDQLVAPHLSAGKALGFAHGFNVHFGRIKPPEDVDVFLVAPKGPGTMLRRQFLAGTGMPAIFAVAQDATGQARGLAMAYASGIGCAKAGLLETTFPEETVTDLFGEQSVLCGGIPELIQAGFETLVEAGYQPEIAYFETVHEVKLIVDLIYERGLAGMRRGISNTAEFGGYVTGERLVTPAVRAEMRRVLLDIQEGRFADQFTRDAEAGFPMMEAQRRTRGAHPAEAVGEALRRQMPFIGPPNQERKP